MLEKWRKCTGLMMVLSTISFIVYCSINATYVIVVNKISLNWKQIPYPGLFKGYIRHTNGKCLTIVGSEVVLKHCLRGSDSQVLFYDEDKILQKSTGKIVVVGEGNALGAAFNGAAIIPLVSNKLMWSSHCVVPVTGGSFPCEETRLKLSSRCDDSDSEFTLQSLHDYDKEHWYRHRYSPWGCPEDICSLNYLPTPVQRCSNCSESCSDLKTCVTAIIETDNLQPTTLTLRSFLKNVKDSSNLHSILVVYSATLRNTEKARMKLEKLSPKIKTYKTLGYIGESGRLNAALSLVKTPYFLLLEQKLSFNKNVNIRKMHRILETTNTKLVAGSPKGSYSGLLYIRQLMSDGVQLIFGSGTYFSAGVHWKEAYPNCHGVDFFPNFYMASTASIRGLGGWTSTLKHHSQLEMYLKAKSGDISPLICMDLKVDLVPARAVISVPEEQLEAEYKLTEAIGVDSVALCRDTKTGYGMLQCQGSVWEFNPCHVDTAFNHVSDRVSHSGRT